MFMASEEDILNSLKMILSSLKYYHSGVLKIPPDTHTLSAQSSMDVAVPESCYYKFSFCGCLWDSGCDWCAGYVCLRVEWWCYNYSHTVKRPSLPRLNKQYVSKHC